MNKFLKEPYFTSLALLLLRTVNSQDEDLSERFSNFSKHARIEEVVQLLSWGLYKYEDLNFIFKIPIKNQGVLVQTSIHHWWGERETRELWLASHFVLICKLSAH